MEDNTAKGWLAKIAKAGQLEHDWREAGRDVVEIYRDDLDDTAGKSDRHGRFGRDSVSFNILHSNTETLKPALYSHSPRPDIRRRFLDDDPIALDNAFGAIVNGAPPSVAFAVDNSSGDEAVSPATLVVNLSKASLS